MVQHNDVTSEQASRCLSFTVIISRNARSVKSYVSEEFLDNFLDFVIWGHEHECLIVPETSASADFYITQPGSSVAVALTEGEARKKYVYRNFHAHAY